MDKHVLMRHTPRPLPSGSLTGNITCPVCWPGGPPSESQRSLLMDTWTLRETTAEWGSCPPSVGHTAPGGWRYRIAAWTEESRTMQRGTRGHNLEVMLASVSLCVNTGSLSFGYRRWRVDHSHIIPILERWAKCRYERRQDQDCS